MTDAETIAALEAANDYQTGLTNQLRRELTEARLEAAMWKQRAEAGASFALLMLQRAAEEAVGRGDLPRAERMREAVKTLQELASVTR